MPVIGPAQIALSLGERSRLSQVQCLSLPRAQYNGIKSQAKPDSCPPTRPARAICLFPYMTSYYNGFYLQYGVYVASIKNEIYEDEAQDDNTTRSS